MASSGLMSGRSYSYSRAIQDRPGTTRSNPSKHPRSSLPASVTRPHTAANLSDKFQTRPSITSSMVRELYPPLPPAGETFIHQAVRDLQTDPNVINKMFERLSQQIINDMKRKAKGNMSRKGSEQRSDLSPNPSFWGTMRSANNRVTPGPLNTSPKNSITVTETDGAEDKVSALEKSEAPGSKGWKAARKLATSRCRRESTFSSNLFNLFLQSKKNDFRTTTVRERQLRGTNQNLSSIPTTQPNIQASIVNERHDLNAARRAKSVFPFSAKL